MLGSSILDFVGHTPLVRIELPEAPQLELYAKVEYFSPSGGPKERIVKRIVEEGERSGRLRPGMALIEATTGSTGIATSLVGAVKGYHVVIVMPEGMSSERKDVIRALGAELVLTPGSGSDVERAIAKVQELVAAEPERYFPVNQFNNPLNVEAHYETTGPEIWHGLGGRVDAFVAMYGTGGTVIGVGKYLKEQDPTVQVFSGEPANSATFLCGERCHHAIEGVGDGIVPGIFDLALVDGLVLVSSEDAKAMAQRLIRRHGLICGPSAGANVFAAARLHLADPSLRRIVTIVPDSGMRYLTTDLYTAEFPEGFLSRALRTERVERGQRGLTVIR